MTTLGTEALAALELVRRRRLGVGIGQMLIVRLRTLACELPGLQHASSAAHMLSSARLKKRPSKSFI